MVNGQLVTFNSIEKSQIFLFFSIKKKTHLILCFEKNISKNIQFKVGWLKHLRYNLIIFNPICYTFRYEK